MKDPNLWTDQSVPGVAACSKCDHVFPSYDGIGPTFECNNGAIINYNALIQHNRDMHSLWYRMKWDTEIVPNGLQRPGWEPI
jgi:hypothetical protein